MSISFQTNIASMAASVNLNNNNAFQTSTIESLTSGYRINHSGDDAAGLAVANGYAANIAELQQGVLNGNDGVNTLQIIDGGLSNISTMLNRMQTLATESASTTFTGNRATLNKEYQTLIGEINREAGNIGLGTTNSTNAANLSVYIGGGQNSGSGSAVNINLTHGLVDAAALGLTGTGVAGTSPVTVGTTANGLIANGTTETFTVNTASGSSSFGITGQAGDTAQSQLNRLNQDLGTVGVSASLDATGKLAFSSPAAFSVSITGAGLATGGELGINSALNNQALNYVAADNPATYTVAEGSKSVNLSVATGLTDSAALQAINSQLAAGGITDIQAVADGSGTTGHFSLQGGGTFAATVTGATTGTVGAFTAAAGGSGALSAIDAVTAAVQLLGNVQGIVGAGENDLNYAIGLANSQITNFSAAESGIRDADVAKEAANLTKAQVLEQASVAAMAQANSAPQVILSLLKG
jgi:flagellin